jgi:hypothetical protein
MRENKRTTRMINENIHDGFINRLRKSENESSQEATIIQIRGEDIHALPGR